MDVNTGELRRLMNNSDTPDGFTEVPNRFFKEAESFLGDKESAFTDMRIPSPLVNWAKREKRKRRNTCLKSNNPGNLNSQAAKEAGLSYWEYMEKTFPGSVRERVWPVENQRRALAKKMAK